MFAARYHEYGGPEVLRVEEAPQPHAGPGQVRIAVRAASVNPFDWKVRAGYLAEAMPTTFPAIPGIDAAGIVDEVGEGVDSAAVGDLVFGVGSATSAEYAVLDGWAIAPAGMTAQVGAALGLATETAARSLDLIDLPAGSTLLVDGAAGGVGAVLVQLARARGLTVVGTASEGRRERLAAIGAIPTTYGAGLAERAAALAPGGVDGAVDVAGQGGVADLVAIVGDPRRVVTIADFSAYPLGVHVADGSAPRAFYALAEVADLYAAGGLSVEVETLPLAEIATAQARSASGQVAGKIVVTVP
jgi:NADPH:quinone reductase-like Zn-dependent oxidoreductase